MRKPGLLTLAAIHAKDGANTMALDLYRLAGYTRGAAKRAMQEAARCHLARE